MNLTRVKSEKVTQQPALLPQHISQQVVDDLVAPLFGERVDDVRPERFEEVAEGFAEIFRACEHVREERLEGVARSVQHVYRLLGSGDVRLCPAVLIQLHGLALGFESREPQRVLPAQRRLELREAVVVIRPVDVRLYVLALVIVPDEVVVEMFFLFHVHRVQLGGEVERVFFRLYEFDAGLFQRVSDVLLLLFRAVGVVGGDLREEVADAAIGVFRLLPHLVEVEAGAFERAFRELALDVGIAARYLLHRPLALFGFVVQYLPAFLRVGLFQPRQVTLIVLVYSLRFVERGYFVGVPFVEHVHLRARHLYPFVFDAVGRVLRLFNEPLIFALLLLGGLVVAACAEKIGKLYFAEITDVVQLIFKLFASLVYFAELFLSRLFSGDLIPDIPCGFKVLLVALYVFQRTSSFVSGVYVSRRAHRRGSLFRLHLKLREPFLRSFYRFFYRARIGVGKLAVHLFYSRLRYAGLALRLLHLRPHAEPDAAADGKRHPANGAHPCQKRLESRRQPVNRSFKRTHGAAGGDDFYTSEHEGLRHFSYDGVRLAQRPIRGADFP